MIKVLCFGVCLIAVGCSSNVNLRSESDRSALRGSVGDGSASIVRIDGKWISARNLKFNKNYILFKTEQGFDDSVSYGNVKEVRTSNGFAGILTGVGLGTVGVTVTGALQKKTDSVDDSMGVGKSVNTLLAQSCIGLLCFFIGYAIGGTSVYKTEN